MKIELLSYQLSDADKVRSARAAPKWQMTNEK